MKGRAGYLFVAMVLVLCLIGYEDASVVAMEGTSYTYTLSRDRSQLIPTLDAYLPAGIYLSDIDLNAPEDMFLSGEKIYIADSGNGRIVICNLRTGDLETLGEGTLQKPTGIVVSSDGRIVVADYGAQEVVVFDNEKKVLTKIGKPEDLIF
jgi:outer membrane protein assembly factor BamB